MAWPQPPLERSIFGIDPIDEFTVTVADWIWEHAKDERNVEVRISRLASLCSL